MGSQSLLESMEIVFRSLQFPSLWSSIDNAIGGSSRRTVGQEVSLNEGDEGQPIPNCQSDTLGDAEETSYHLEAGMISPWAFYN
jgi:hypothetical protein